ncbi:MAG: nitroreductase family protein [Clostridiales bacterium]|nr:nitroreductase family protein [Clostridiales bacterium]
MKKIRELVELNRSYRGYDESRRISREELVELVECARLCPSSVNIQPLKYRLVFEKEEVDRLQKETHWAKALPELTLPHEGMCPTAFIVICQDTRVSSVMNRFLRDIGAVAQTMLLAAVEMGLGGCMIGNFRAESVRETLNLPESITPMLVVAFGKPAEKVVLTEIADGESTMYYRDENDVHYVPKRKLEDIIL